MITTFNRLGPVRRVLLFSWVFWTVVASGDIRRQGAGDPPPPPSPVTVQETSLASGLVTLNWSPVEGAIGYEILRGVSTDVLVAALVGTNVPGQDTWTDSNAPYGVDLHYWVRSVGENGPGPTGTFVTARQTVLMWTWNFVGKVTAPVVGTNGQVIVGIGRAGPFDQPPRLGQIISLSPTGAETWSFDPGTSGLSNPAIDEAGRVHVAVVRGNQADILTLSSQGQLVRTLPGTTVSGSVAIGNDGSVFCFGRSPQFTLQVEGYSVDGLRVWTGNTASSGSLVPQAVVQTDGVVLLGNTGAVSAFGPFGQRLWSLDRANTQWSPPALVSRDRFRVFNNLQELISVRMDGTPEWTNRVAVALGTTVSPVVDRLGRTYVVDTRGVVHAVDDSGTKLWQQPLNVPVTFPPMLDQEGQLLAPVSGVIQFLGPQGEIRRTLFLGDVPIQPPVLTETGVLVVALKDRIRAYQLPSGLDRQAPWPMARHDPRGTSALAGPPGPPATPEILPPQTYANQVVVELKPEGRPVRHELWRAGSPDLNQAVRLGVFDAGLLRLSTSDILAGPIQYYWVRAVRDGEVSPWAGPVAAASVSIPRRWTFAPAGRTPPAIAPDGTVYTSGASGLTALGPTGSPLWTIAGLDGQPVVAPDGTVILRSAGQLFSITPAGTTNWVRENTAHRGSAPAVDPSGRILTPGAVDQFVAYSVNGDVQWQFTVGVQSPFSPSIAEDGLLVMGGDNGALYLRRSDGSEVLTGTMPALAVGGAAPPWTPAGEFIVLPETPFGVQLVGTNGAAVWSASSERLIWAPPAVGSDGSVYALLNRPETPGGVNRPWVLALDAAGAVRWQQPTEAGNGTPVLTANGWVLANGTNSIRAWNARTGASAWVLSTTNTAPLVSAVLDHDGTLYVASDGTLEAYDLGVGPALAPWPMHRQNPRQSACVARPAGPTRLELKSVTPEELTLDVTAPGPLVLLMESSDLRAWRRRAVWPTDGSSVRKQHPREDTSGKFYQLVLP